MDEPTRGRGSRPTDPAGRAVPASRGGAGPPAAHRPTVTREADPARGEAVDATATVDLVVCEGEVIGRRFRVRPGDTIGRSAEAALQLPDRLVSRLHARLVAVDGKLAVEDLGSHNGVHVNGVRVAQRELLFPGDVIRVGDTPLAVHVPRPARDTAAPPLLDAVGGPGRVAEVVSEEELATPSIASVSTDDFLKAVGAPSGDDVEAADARTLQRVLSRTRHFAVVYGICKEIGTAGRLDDLLLRALQAVHAVTGAHRGHIVVLDAGADDPGAVVSVGPDGLPGKGPDELSHTVIDWVVRNRAGVLSSDAREDDRFRDGKSVAELDIRSLLCVPMLNAGAVLGVIELDRRPPARRFGREDLRMVSVLAPVLALVVANARLDAEQRRTLVNLRRAHGELVLAEEALLAREKMAVIGRFAAGMAHEIRNALTPLSLLADLAGELPAGSAQREDLELMSDAVDRLATLVEDIRLLSQGERTPLRPAEHDLARTLESVCAVVRCDPSVRPHTLLVETNRLPPVVYDEPRVKQALVNLVHGAALSMEAPGRIALRAALDSRDPDLVVLEVADDGPGLAPDDLAGGWPAAADPAGPDVRGVGLDVTRRIVEQHGGSLTCRREPGGGTTMTVRLLRSGPPPPRG